MNSIRELAKAARVADFLELGELFAKDALERTNLVEVILEKNLKLLKEKQCEMIKTSPLFLLGNTRENHLKQNCIKSNWIMKKLK